MFEEGDALLYGLARCWADEGVQECVLLTLGAEWWYCDFVFFVVLVGGKKIQVDERNGDAWLSVIEAEELSREGVSAFWLNVAPGTVAGDGDCRACSSYWTSGSLKLKSTEGK